MTLQVKKGCAHSNKVDIKYKKLFREPEISKLNLIG